MRAIQRAGATDLLRRAFTGFRLLSDSERTWWGVLGVARDASELAILAAHRRRSLEVHPDRGGDVAEQAAVNRARDDGLAARRAS